MKWSQKVGAVAAALLLGFGILSGCSGQAKEVNISEISSKLTSDLTWEDGMRKLEDSVIENLYQLDSEQVVKKEVYIGETGATAEEIALVELKDASGVDAVKEELEKRVESQKKQFENYVPAEMQKLNNAVVTSSGKYVMLLVSGDYEKGEEIFHGFF